MNCLNHKCVAFSNLKFMFEESQNFQKQEPEDIFSQTEKIVPKKMTAGQTETFDFRGKRRVKAKKLVIIIVFLLIGGGLVYAGYFGYGNFQRLMAERKEKPAVESENALKEKASEIKTPVISEDADADGLSDKEENRYGTKTDKVDTDGDGLSDREEIKVYKTNPLKPDTDGDGFLDGQEARYGYDPNNSIKGAKLTDLKKEIEKLNQ